MHVSLSETHHTLAFSDRRNSKDLVFIAQRRTLYLSRAFLIVGVMAALDEYGIVVVFFIS